MPNIGAVLREEIRRLAKKEVRAEIGKTKDAVVQHRHDIAALKRRIRAQEKQIAFLKARLSKQPGQTAHFEETAEKIRYSARSVRSQRARLGLSAADYGILVGVSGLTVYNWEHGKVRPRKPQIDALVAVRGIGKQEALQTIAERKRAAKTGRRRTNKKLR